MNNLINPGNPLSPLSPMNPLNPANPNHPANPSSVFYRSHFAKDEDEDVDDGCSDIGDFLFSDAMLWVLTGILAVLSVVCLVLMAIMWYAVFVK